MKSILDKKCEAIFIKNINPKEIVKKWKNIMGIELSDEFKNLKADNSKIVIDFCGLSNQSQNKISL